ncbi:MAG TPA: hypothetical protein ENJ82_10000, partial [Bacteroidetes bacterium]|nr:hypothetical protein [Bacteroidota bacterium]
MSVLAIILLVLGALLLVLCLIGWSMTSRWKLEERIMIRAAREPLYDYLNELTNWEEWTIWNKQDNPNFIFHYRGPKEGKGAQQCWKNKGHYGTTKICGCQRPACIEYMIAFGGAKSHMTGTLQLLPRGTSTEVVWSISGDAGVNPFKRIFVRLM